MQFSNTEDCKSALRRTQANQTAAPEQPRPAGESGFDFLQSFQPRSRVKRRFVIAAREKVVEATEPFCVKYAPALRPVWDFLPEEQSCRVALRGDSIGAGSGSDSARLIGLCHPTGS